MGRQLYCDVDWEIAPSGTAFYSEGYFRNEKGDWWSEVWGRWCSTQYTVEELYEANDYEPKPKESEMEDTEWTRLCEQDSVAKKVDWPVSPEDAEFYAYWAFRKQWRVGLSYFEAYWEATKGRWITTTYVPVDKQQKDHPDFEWKPSTEPVYDESVDDKWDNGELGRDEEFVKVSEQSEALSNLLKEATNIASSGGTFIKVVPLDTPKTSIQFLDEVKHIQSERAAEYEQDAGERSFAKISTVFNTYTGKDLVPSDIALILEILKNVRFYSQDGYHRDSVVDKISYGSLWAELVTEERK